MMSKSTVESRAPMTLIYTGWLPRSNAQQVHWRYRQRLRRAALRAFGELPRGLHATQKAAVVVTRVLGPRQRRMDRDNLAWLCKPLLDAVVAGGYLVDDSETWADIRYVQDETRRQEGPRIEVEITYDGAARWPTSPASHRSRSSTT